MRFTIAIQPDHLTHRNGEVQSFSDRWIELAREAGMQSRVVNAYRADFFEQLAGTDGFMWRFGYFPLPRVFAKRLLSAVEHGLGLPVFPSWRDAWHFEDKVAQHYLLQAAGIPTPQTWVFWRARAARRFAEAAQYPLVLKLSYGFQSSNVRLLHDAAEARHWIRQLFGPGVDSLEPPARGRAARLGARARQALDVLRGRVAPRPEASELQHGYAYFQEFLAGNAYDTRVTVIGDRAYVFRRRNRPDDFRASGSGLIDFDPQPVDEPSVRLAFRIARTLGTESVAVDVLRRGDERVAGEISYTFATWALRDCPGHWRLDGDADTGRLTHVEGHLRPEDAIFETFVARLARGRVAGTPELTLPR